MGQDSEIAKRRSLLAHGVSLTVASIVTGEVSMHMGPQVVSRTDMVVPCRWVTRRALYSLDGYLPPGIHPSKTGIAWEYVYTLLYKISISRIYLILIQQCKISSSREFLPCHEARQLLSVAIFKLLYNLVKYVLLFPTPIIYELINAQQYLYTT